MYVGKEQINNALNSFPNFQDDKNVKYEKFVKNKHIVLVF